MKRIPRDPNKIISKCPPKGTEAYSKFFIEQYKTFGKEYYKKKQVDYHHRQSLQRATDLVELTVNL